MDHVNAFLAATHGEGAPQLVAIRTRTFFCPIAGRCLGECCQAEKNRHRKAAHSRSATPQLKSGCPHDSVFLQLTKPDCRPIADLTPARFPLLRRLDGMILPGKWRAILVLWLRISPDTRVPGSHPSIQFSCLLRKYDPSS